MAAGHQRKRLASSNLHELQEKKKKKVDSSDYILNLRSHVNLQWDDAQKRVVAKREQVGITWKDMSPYVDSVPKFHSGLADVFSFPKEVFDLDNLMEVLSHKVWLTCLSVSERKLLLQFLPNCGFDEHSVQSLLTGENLHFGSPILKWSALLCSSDLHPDILVQKERQTRISKKQYNLEINKYHTNMVAMLRKLKEKSETCEDPEKLWRKLSILNNSGEGVGSEMLDDYSIEKKELPMKMYNRYVDVTKYMSYIKVNKKQFKMLEELKHYGDHIRSKSINRVLGDIKNFHIYPYESYDYEENKKLREHWIQVTKDTLTAYETYCKRKFLKMQQMECLEKELAESRTLIHDKKPLETSLFASSDVLQPAPIIDLDVEIIGRGVEQLIPSAFNVDTDSQMFSSCIQNHEEEIPTFPMASEMLSTSHMHDLSQPGLQFLINHGNLPGTDRFSLLEDNQRRIKERHACDKELYMKNMLENNFCAKITHDNLLRYHPSSSSRCTMQSSVTQNWFPDVQHSHNVWTGTESSGNGVQSGGGISFDATSGSEQLMQARNYIDLSLADSYIATQVSSSTGLASAAIPSLDMIWMNNYYHKNPPTLQESVRKPFMRHWNQ